MVDKKRVNTKDPELVINPKTGEYWYRGTPRRGLGTKEHPLHEKTYGLAKEAKANLLFQKYGVSSVDRKLKSGKKQNIYFQDFARDLLQKKLKERSKNTYDQAYYSSKHVLPFFGTMHPKDIDQDAVSEFVAYERKKSDRLFEYDMRFIVSVLLEAKRVGVIKEVPEFKNVDPPRAQRRKLTKEEIRAIFQNSIGHLYGLVLFMYTMGPRPTEVMGAPWAEFDLVKGIWNIPAARTKTRESRSIKLNPKVLEWLKSQKKTSTSLWVFPSRNSDTDKPVKNYNKQWARMIDRAGLGRDIVAYHLRHTFLSECAMKVTSGQLPLALVVKYAGTSIEQFEKTYLHIEGEDTKAVSELIDLGSDL
jgi:integrase